MAETDAPTPSLAAVSPSDTPVGTSQEASAPSTSLAAVSLSDTPIDTSQQACAPRQNLPLPRELRDKIWGYLLHHEHVREGLYRDRPMDKRGKTSEQDAREISRAHTFTFHTNILAVNRHIKDECLKVLKSNDFVIISSKGVLDPEIKHVTSIPIVTENHGHCARLKHHVLRVHIQASPGLNRKLDKAVPTDLKVFCVVAADLPRFCKTLRTRVLTMACPAKFLYSSEGMASVEDPIVEVDASDGEDVYIRTNIRFETTEISASRAKQLLSAFRYIVQGKQRVIISNAPDDIAQDVQQLKDIMSPQTIWINAQAWFALQALRDELAEIEASVRAGDLENVVQRSSEAILMGQFPCFLGQPVGAYSSEAALPSVLLVLTLLDAVVTEWQLRVRLGGKHLELLDLLHDHLDRLVTWLQATPAIDTAKLTEESWPTPCRAIWAMRMIVLTGTSIEEAIDNLCSLEEILQGEPHFEYDMNLLREVKDNKKLRAKLMRKDGVNFDFLNRTSACQLPVRYYRNPYVDSFQPPSGLEGYVDSTRLAKLKKEYPGRYDYL